MGGPGCPDRRGERSMDCPLTGTKYPRVFAGPITVPSVACPKISPIRVRRHESVRFSGGVNGLRALPYHPPR